MEQLALDLAKLELERDHYKYEVEQKQQRLQEYETEIAQYRTKALYPGGQHSAVYHSHKTRIKELEDSLKEHKCDLVTKDAKIKQLEDQLDNEKVEMEKERSVMKQSQDTKERELKQNMSKLQNDLDLAKAAKSTTEGQLKSVSKQYDEQRQQLQQSVEELGRTRKQLELKEESNQNIEEIRSKLKAEITALEQTIEKSKIELIQSKTKVYMFQKHVQHELDKKSEELCNLHNDLVREKKENKRLEKEVHSLKEENQQIVLRTITRIDAMEEEHKKQFYELTIARDEKTQLAADHEEKIIQLEQQLQDAYNLVEQITREKANLETELQSQQVRYASVFLTTHDHLLYMYTQCIKVLSVLLMTDC